MGKVGLITYPDSGPIGKLADLFATFAGSINTALPVKFVPTLAALNAMGLSVSSLPAGTLAILTADDSGLSAGAQFSMHPDGKWRLIGACTALNVATFVTSLTANTNIKTLAGATCWNASTSGMVVFTSTGGANSAVTTAAKASGSGLTTSALAPGTSLAVPTSFPAGAFNQTPSNILVTADNSRATCAPMVRTKDGFSLQISNWSNGAIPAGTPFYWTAFA